ncbi:hypothetical protein FE257_012401 [Aspergillus nanangensis]|uniref:Acetyl-CoA synthetase-like protein n=1 Tax=Aspergillus nanangensis TaxID=2582783 RepID=A0AAD4GXQ9_ASPNN|nr:hypothetical protein FE257_012401 [Aspergillus nanangensis]
MTVQRMQQNAQGIISCSLKVEIPAVDLFTYVFSSGTPVSRQSPQYFDATAPAVNYCLEDAELMARQFGRGLQSSGLRKQDKVLLYSPNSLFFPVVIWAVTAAGGVFTGASPTASVYELEYQLRDSEATFVLTSAEGLEVTLKAAEKVGLPRERVLLFGTPYAQEQPSSSRGIRPWTDIWASVEEAKNWNWERISSQTEAMSTTAVINYSSGTTGFPKGVELTHYNIISNAEQIISKRTLAPNTPSGHAHKERLDTSGERWLAAVPMYHAFGQSYFCVIAPRLAAKVYIMPKFDLYQYLTFVDIYRITFINVVPTILAMLCKVPSHERFNFQAIDLVTSGAAPLDPVTAQKFQGLYLRCGTRVRQGYGLTETTSNVTGFAPGDEDDGRSIGWLSPNCKAKIVPVQTTDFGVSDYGQEVGELWVAGPNIMKGYWKRDAVTEETIVVEDGERWLRTGDVGYVDDRGCFYIVDRIKELIKVNGLQVSPAELEKGLMGHPGVIDAAVVGHKKDTREFPRAFIVRKSTSTTPEELHKFIKARFARHKWLSGGIFFVPAIPRNASGKIVRRQLPTPGESKL